MSTALAIFVKTPSLSPLKTRLAAGIGKEKAEEFYIHSLKAIEKTVKQTHAKVFWAVGEQEGLNNPLWRAFETIYTGEGGLGERQHYIYNHLLSNHDRVILIGADAPQLSPCILERSIEALNTHDFVLGPANDGGYYLFGGRIPVNRHIWSAVPWSTKQTRQTLEGLLSSKPCHLEPLTDVDTQNDLQQLKTEMPEAMSDEQQNLLDWVSSL